MDAAISGQQPHASDRGNMNAALDLAEHLTTLFSSYLDKLETGEVNQELRDRLTDQVKLLQRPENLVRTQLPEDLLRALCHIDARNPEITLGYVREALVYASRFNDRM